MSWELIKNPTELLPGDVLASPNLSDPSRLGVAVLIGNSLKWFLTFKYAACKVPYAMSAGEVQAFRLNLLGSGYSKVRRKWIVWRRMPEKTKYSGCPFFSRALPLP